MILAIDIGNSNVVIGTNDDEWKHIWRLPTLNNLDSLEFYDNQLANLLVEYDILPSDIHEVVVSSVVPDLNTTFTSVVKRISGKTPYILGPRYYHHFPLLIDRPDEIGSDLVANALAAHHKYGGNRIVIDFGTALTFTIVNGNGHILGVNIVPGLQTAIKALFSNTAQLPEVPLELPESVIGKNTVHAIQSGVLHGYVGLVKHKIGMIKKELGNNYTTIATGGLSKILTPLESDFDIIDRNLTLEGLKIFLQEYLHK